MHSGTSTVLFTLITRLTVTNDPNPPSIHSHSLSLHDPLYRLHSAYSESVKLQLSESLSSLSLLSPLQFISAWGSGMDRGNEGCIERTGRHRPYTRCHPWPISEGWFWS